MGYSKRDLRAADMLALVFVGLGIAIVAYGVVGWVGGVGGAKPQDGKDGEKIVAPDQAAAPAGADEKKKASEGSDPPDLVPLIFGAVFLALGGALHFKVRQLQRNGGVEPSEDEGAVGA
ncbi:MAG: hypothetical protein JJU33_14835 [Phycisphaerales bacterium]|nr:hypothetical protein [Phycisphaerales bacterium]